MRKFIYSLLIISLCGAYTFSQDKSNRAKNKPNKIEAELMQLERDIGDANIRRDKAFFERVEAEEFIFTDSGGGITTKAEDVAGLDKPAGDFKLVSYTVDDMKVR